MKMITFHFSTAWKISSFLRRIMHIRLNAACFALGSILINYFIFSPNLLLADTIQKPDSAILQLSYKDGKTYSNGEPLFLKTYDSTGLPVSTGFISLSGIFENVQMNIVDVPIDKSPWEPTLGVQIKKKRKIEAMVSINRAIDSAVFIDRDGIVFSSNSRKLDLKGPFISIAFFDSSNNQISIPSLNIIASSNNKN
jgi:hypothetical protein